MTEQPWIPAVTGQPIDLVVPRADQVDFRSLAHALANTHRYGGHGETQVSVALHTLIGLDLCPAGLEPWWLIHDGHEWTLGDITTPALQALSLIGDEVAGSTSGGAAVRGAVQEFKRRHDIAIHAAAGLPLPTFQQRAAIAEIDERCLATEHRDFHRASARPWAHEARSVKPARKLHRWAAAPKVAEQLLARFERHLPALRAMAA